MIFIRRGYRVHYVHFLVLLEKKNSYEYYAFVINQYQNVPKSGKGIKEAAECGWLVGATSETDKLKKKIEVVICFNI